MMSLQKRHIIFSHIVLILFLLTLVDEGSIQNIEKFLLTYVVALLITFGLTLNWTQSVIISFFVVVFVRFLDDNPGFFGINENFEEFQQSNGVKGKVDPKTVSKLKSMVNEDVVPAGDGEDQGIMEASHTKDKDDTGLMEDDLDNILATDEDNEKRGDEAQKDLFEKAGGGLEGLSKLLQSAREESPDSEEKTADDHTPAEAQRKTHQMINTMKMLKETMTEMIPVMKQSSQVMNLYNKLGGKDMMKSFS